MSGIEPLVDRFGRPQTYLRLSLTDRCNFRCRYCMPEEGVPLAPKAEVLTLEELEHLTEVFASLGIDKVRLTGGEPTLRKGWMGLASRISKIPGITAVGLTTNGTTLPTQAQQIRDSGVTELNLSLDSLNKELFEEITGRDDLDRVLAGLDAAVQAGFKNLKLNVVVMRGVNEHEVGDFALLTKDLPITVRYIEFMPFGGNEWSRAKLAPLADIRKAVDAVCELEPLPLKKDFISRDHAVSGHKGKIGFIASMTESFCSGCSRIRLTAQGEMKTCLFFPPETSLRDLLRSGASDDLLRDTIRKTVMKKRSGHPDLLTLQTVSQTAMTVIGG